MDISSIHTQTHIHNHNLIQENTLLLLFSPPYLIMDSRPATTQEWTKVFVLLFIGYLLALRYIHDTLFKILVMFLLPHTAHTLVIGNMAHNSVFHMVAFYRALVRIPETIRQLSDGNAPGRAGLARAAAAAGAAWATHRAERRMQEEAQAQACRCGTCTCRTAEVAALERRLRESQQYAQDTNEFTKTVYDGLNTIINRLQVQLVDATPETGHGRLALQQDRILNIRETLMNLKRAQDEAYVRTVTEAATGGSSG